MATKKNTSQVKCVSVGLVLCATPLDKVLGYIGRKKMTQGVRVAKQTAIFELISCNGLEFTEQEILEGAEISRKRN